MRKPKKQTAWTENRMFLIFEVNLYRQKKDMHDNTITITIKILNSSTLAEEFIISRFFDLALTHYYLELHKCRTVSSSSHKELFLCLWHLLEYRDNLAKLKPPTLGDN